MSFPEPKRLDQIEYHPADDVWVVEEFLRPNTLNILAGPIGIGKTFIRKELEHRAASGVGSLLGRYPIARPLRVLTIDEDNGEAEDARRDEVMLEELGLERGDLLTAYRTSLINFRLDTAEGQAWLRQQVAEKAIELLLLDPVSEMYVAKEVREELLPTWHFLKRLLADFPDLTIVIFHHLRKAQPGQGTAPRGLEDLRGGLWGQVASAVAIMSPLGERRVKWEVHKRVPHSELILEQDVTGTFHVLHELAESRASTDERVRAAIDAGAETADEVMAGTGIGKTAVYGALRRLREAGTVAPGQPLRRTLQ